jgi:hypothetical protein
MYLQSATKQPLFVSLCVRDGLGECSQRSRAKSDKEKGLIHCKRANYGVSLANGNHATECDPEDDGFSVIYGQQNPRCRARRVKGETNSE